MIFMLNYILPMKKWILSIDQLIKTVSGNGCLIFSDFVVYIQSVIYLD